MGVISKNNTALHGEKVGVATVLVLKKYHEATKHHLTESEIIDYDYNYNGLIKEKFSYLSDEIIKENAPDPLKKVTISALLEKWEKVRIQHFGSRIQKRTVALSKSTFSLSIQGATR